MKKFFGDTFLKYSSGRKLSKKSCVFVPYDVRMYILEFLISDISEFGRLKDYFGYFHADKTRKIYQTFKSIKIRQKSENMTGISQIPLRQTKYMWLTLRSGLLRKISANLKSFRNLREIVLVTSCVNYDLYKELGQLPKLTKVKIVDGSADLSGLKEMMMSSKSLELFSISSFSQLVQQTREQLCIDFCQLHLESVKKVLRLRFFLITNSCVPSKPIDLNTLYIQHCTLTKEFFTCISRYSRRIRKIRILHCHITSEHIMTYFFSDSFITKVLDCNCNLIYFSSQGRGRRPKKCLLDVRIRKIKPHDDQNSDYNFSLHPMIDMTDTFLKSLKNVKVMSLLLINRLIKRDELFSIRSPSLRVFCIKDFTTRFSDRDCERFRKKKNCPSCRFLGNMKVWEELEYEQKFDLLGLGSKRPEVIQQ